MKKSAGLILFIFILLINSHTSAQYQAAVPFLAYPVSSMNAGMGSVGTSLPTDNVYGFLYNPAQLGYSSRFNNLGFQFYVNNPVIGQNNTGAFGLRAEIKSLGIDFGYNFESLLKIPIWIGTGFANPEFTYYNLINSQNLFSGKDSYEAYSVGIGSTYYVNFSAGLTFKNIRSELSNEVPVRSGDGNPGVMAYDIGFLLNIPIMELLEPEFRKSILGDIPVIPLLDFSVGYSQSNIGDKVYYIDPAQSDPLPRIARAGYGISAGIRLQKEIYDIEIFHFDFASEAEDYLIVRDSTGSFSYQPAFGDINIWTNVLGIKGDDNVYSHCGIKISFLESAEFMWGHISSAGSMNKTNGFILRVKGLFRYLSDQKDNDEMNFIADHIDIRYYSSTYLVDAFQETSFQGIEVLFSNFIF